MKKVIFVLLAAALLVACAGKASSSDSIEGKSYNFASHNGYALRADPAPVLTIGEDGQISGSLCNSFRGPVSLENNVMKATMIATKKFCLDVDINQAESAFFKALSEGAAFNLSDGKLTIKSGADSFILLEK